MIRNDRTAQAEQRAYAGTHFASSGIQTGRASGRYHPSTRRTGAGYRPGAADTTTTQTRWLECSCGWRLEDITTTGSAARPAGIEWSAATRSFLRHRRAPATELKETG